MNRNKKAKSDTTLTSVTSTKVDFLKDSNSNKNNKSIIFDKISSIKNKLSSLKSSTGDNKPANKKKNNKINFNKKVDVLKDTKKGENHYIVKLKKSNDCSRKIESKSTRKKNKKKKNITKEKIKRKRRVKVTTKSPLEGGRTTGFRRRYMKKVESEDSTDDDDDDSDDSGTDDVSDDKVEKVRTIFPPVTISKKGKMFLEGRAKRLKRHKEVLKKINTRSFFKSVQYKPFEFNGFGDDKQKNWSNKNRWNNNLFANYYHHHNMDYNHQCDDDDDDSDDDDQYGYDYYRQYDNGHNQYPGYQFYDYNNYWDGYQGYDYY